MKNTLQKTTQRLSVARWMAILLACAAAANMPALAQTPASSAHSTAASASASASAHDGHAAAEPAPATAAEDQAELSEGEITRWDARTLRVTLRHGELKNLEMPPMTMVFRVQNAGVLGDLKTGDKVRFRAERVSGAFHVNHIEKAH